MILYNCKLVYMSKFYLFVGSKLVVIHFGHQTGWFSLFLHRPINEV